MRRSIIVVPAIVLLCTCVIFGQQMLLNQTYVNQFPTVERLRSEEKGTDEVDSYARFVAALEVINDFMVQDLLKAPNGSMYQMPPTADKIHDQYRNAITKNIIDSPAPPSKDPRYRPLRDKYESDPAFADSLLQRYFTPQFRTDYYAWTRKPMPAATAVKANAPTVVASTDPSIAKAKAAKIDLSLFAGAIRIGDPLRLPRCPYKTNMFGIPELDYLTQDCEDIPVGDVGNAKAAIDILATILPAPPPGKPAPTPDPNVTSVGLIEEHRPTWMSGETVGIRTSPNGIERVVIITQGRDVEKKVAEELVGKYGPASYVTESTITPQVGNAFKVSNMDWLLPGLRIEYKVIEADDNGKVKLDDPGYVRIETETAYQARIAAQKKEEQKKRVL